MNNTKTVLDNAGRIISEYTRAISREYTYDDKTGLLKTEKRVNHNTGYTVNSYYENGNVVLREDSNGCVDKWTYNSDGNLTWHKDQYGCTSFHYSNGELVTQESSNGHVWKKVKTKDGYKILSNDDSKNWYEQLFDICGKKLSSIITCSNGYIIRQ